MSFLTLRDEDLFDVMEVAIKLCPEDMPGRPMQRVQCNTCGEYIQDMREIYQDGKVPCVPCSGSGYYEVKKSSIVIRYAEKS